MKTAMKSGLSASTGLGSLQDPARPEHLPVLHREPREVPHPAAPAMPLGVLRSLGARRGFADVRISDGGH